MFPGSPRCAFLDIGVHARCAIRARVLVPLELASTKPTTSPSARVTRTALSTCDFKVILRERAEWLEEGDDDASPPA
jgi:hypothetical protein